jgi:uncharacterized protein YjdB
MGSSTSWVMALAGLGLLAACERPLGLTQPQGSPVVQVVTSPTSVTLDPYQTQQFLAYGRTQAGDSVAVVVTWSASGGTITSGGLYAADTAAGSYQVTATAQVPASAPAASSTSTTVSGRSQVTNRGQVVQLVLTPTTASLIVGGTVQFVAFGRRKSGDSVAVTVVYSATGGTISPAGLYTAGQSVGTYHVIATQSGGTLADTVAVTVSNVPVASVAVSPAAASLTVGATTQLTATPKDSNGTALSGRAVMWASSNPSVATVSASGLVTGVAAGSATITATSEGKSGTSAIAVTNVPVATVTVSPAAASVSVGATVQLTATTKDSAGGLLTGRVVTWASSNPAVATVSASGLVTGVAAGSATITATSEGKSGTSAIAVTNVPVATVTVSPAAASVAVGATVQLTATLKDALGNPLSGRVVTWASSAPSVAAVSGTGLVTGLTVGAATLTATSEGQSGSAAVSVSGATPLYTLGSGNNYYVAPSGSDANPCTTAAPCYTMQRVSQLMSPGDNAHFAPGNYTWTYSGNKVTVSGTAAAPISYVSDTKWGAKISGSGCDPIWNSGAYVQIINFDVTGNCSEGIGVNGNYDKVIGNRVHDLPGTGGYAGILADCCSYTLVGIQIIGNVVDNIAMGTGSNLIHGIYAAGPSSVIMNNIVTRASAACITHYHGATHAIVSNNVVAGCKYGIQIAADGALTSDDYTTVDNNIAVNNGRGIYEFPTAGPHNVYNNNIVYNNSTANFDLCCGGTQSGSITLTAAQFSALFVNYTGDMSGDYHLQNGAVAIDAGTTSCAAGITSCVPLLDFDGVARPVGLAYAIGAYEWH